MWKIWWAITKTNQLTISFEASVLCSLTLYCRSAVRVVTWRTLQGVCWLVTGQDWSKTGKHKSVEAKHVTVQGRIQYVFSNSAQSSLSHVYLQPTFPKLQLLVLQQKNDVYVDETPKLAVKSSMPFDEQIASAAHPLEICCTTLPETLATKSKCRLVTSSHRINKFAVCILLKGIMKDIKNDYLQWRRLCTWYLRYNFLKLCLYTAHLCKFDTEVLQLYFGGMKRREWWPYAGHTCLIIYFLMNRTLI